MSTGNLSTSLARFLNSFPKTAMCISFLTTPRRTRPRRFMHGLPSTPPRWTFHLTPTSSSWMNAVEEFFAKLTSRRLKYAILNSIDECETPILRFIEAHNNTEAKPFRWTADPEKIITARKRGSISWNHHTSSTGVTENIKLMFPFLRMPNQSLFSGLNSNQMGKKESITVHLS